MHRAIPGQSVFERGSGTADFAFTGQEHEDTAAVLAGLRLGAGNQIHQRIGAAGLGTKRGIEPAGLHRETAALGGDERRLHQGADGGGIQRCGHRQQDQIVAQGARDLKTEREAEISIQRAFVEFVEDHRSDSGQVGV